MPSKSKLALAEQFLEYVNETGSPFHSVDSLIKRLSLKGFVELQQNGAGRKPTTTPAKQGYMVSANRASILAYRAGSSVDPGRTRFIITATHTDSPAPVVRPVNRIKSEGYELLGCELYGGGLWHTWFDRGLGLAGKVVVKGELEGQTPKLVETLVRIPEPVCFIPNLAIHLTSRDSSGFTFSTENEFRPVICSSFKLEGGNSPSKGATAGDDEAKSGDNKETCGKKSDDSAESPLMTLLAGEVEKKAGTGMKVVDYELYLMDATPSRFCGMLKEFVESPRLDNLASTFTAFHALQTLEVDSDNCDIHVAVAFNNEEIGSATSSGAMSYTLERWLLNIVEELFGEENAMARYRRIMERSFIVSTDNAHGVHPNYPSKHQSQHKPMFHQGVVLKTNANGRYTTDCVGRAIAEVVSSAMGVPVQQFVVPNGSPCGSTIGPLMATKYGVSCIDIGVPQWAMHSCREICGVDDFYNLERLLTGFYELYSKTADSMGRC